MLTDILTGQYEDDFEVEDSYHYESSDDESDDQDRKVIIKSNRFTVNLFGNICIYSTWC